jgi:hypothetical protein
MSPFYHKEGENWVPLGRHPIDIQVGRDGKNIAGIYPAQDDPEQIRINVQGDLIVEEEDGGVYHDEGDPVLINRRDVIIRNIRYPLEREIIIHSEEPIG